MKPRPIRALAAALLLSAALAGCDRNDGKAPAAGDFAGDLNALGTEPFWGVAIRADHLTLSRPGEDDIQGANAGPKIDGGSATWTVSGGAKPFTLTVTKADCSDQMSDRHYPYKAFLTLDERTIAGCAATPEMLASKPAP